MQEYRNATDQASAHYQRSLVMLSQRKTILGPRLEQAWSIVTELATQSARIHAGSHSDQDTLNLRLTAAYDRALELDRRYMHLLLAETALLNELEDQTP